MVQINIYLIINVVHMVNIMMVIIVLNQQQMVYKIVEYLKMLILVYIIQMKKVKI